MRIIVEIPGLLVSKHKIIWGSLFLFSHQLQSPAVIKIEFVNCLIMFEFNVKNFNAKAIWMREREREKEVAKERKL